MFDPLALPIVLLIFAGAAALVWMAGMRLSDTTDVLSFRLGLGEALGGLILLAIVTNLPEIAITVSAALSKELGVAVGNILGGSRYRPSCSWCLTPSAWGEGALNLPGGLPLVGAGGSGCYRRSHRRSHGQSAAHLIHRLARRSWRAAHHGTMDRGHLVDCQVPLRASVAPRRRRPRRPRGVPRPLQGEEGAEGGQQRSRYRESRGRLLGGGRRYAGGRRAARAKRRSHRQGCRHERRPVRLHLPRCRHRPAGGLHWDHLGEDGRLSAGRERYLRWQRLLASAVSVGEFAIGRCCAAPCPRHGHLSYRAWVTVYASLHMRLDLQARPTHLAHRGGLAGGADPIPNRRSRAGGRGIGRLASWLPTRIVHAQPSK